MAETDSAQKAPVLAWLDDDKAFLATRPRPQTWLEELGELNEQGKLDAVSQAFQSRRKQADEEDDGMAWL